MRFDVIVGNPPYQINDGGYGCSASHIFHLFVYQGENLNPDYLTLIIPARWYAGGKGLDSFRESMLKNKHIKTLFDFESSKSLFHSVNIAGGICFFLWSKNHIGKCEVVNISEDNKENKENRMVRVLDKYPVFIRSNLAYSIIQKVMDKTEGVLSDIVYLRDPFGVDSTYIGREYRIDGDIQILTSSGVFYIQRQEIKKNMDIIDSYKVIIGKVIPGNGEVEKIHSFKTITNPRILEPGCICTQSYLVLGVFNTKEKAENYCSYLHCRLTRFLLRQSISSVNITKSCFRFVPMQNFDRPWTDKELYSMYDLSDGDIEYIEYMTKPM